MKVLLKSRYSSDQKGNLIEIVSRKLDGTDYDRGELETIKATASNTAEAFGQLLEVLIERDNIRLEDVTKILGLYETTIELSF